MTTPWGFRRILEVIDKGISLQESSAVPSGTPASDFGTIWLRDDDPPVPMYTDEAGTDFVLIGRSWACSTQQTTDATPTNVTVLANLAAGEQSPVWVLIKADNGANNTYFREQLYTFYNDAGVSLWTIEKQGLEQRRGLTTATATLAVSGSDIVVTVTGEAATTIDWTICFLTSNTLEGGVAGGGTSSSAGIYPVLTGTTLTTAATLAVGDYQKYDPVGGTFIIDMPGTATVGDLVGIKNVDTTLSATGITLDGNGGNVENPAGFALSATVSVTGDGIGLLYQYDGTDWYLV